MTATIISQSFERPADTTAYTVGDLVANSTTAGSVVPLLFDIGYRGFVRGVKLHKSSTGISATNFRVHIFKTAPVTITNGDNGAFSVSGVGDYLGAFDVTIDQAFTDGAAGFGVPLVGLERIKTEDNKVYALIEARGAYTPVSGETFTLALESYII